LKSTAIAWTALGTAVKEIGRSVIGIHRDVSSLGDVNLFFPQMNIKRMLDFTHLYGFINILNHMGGEADVPAISSILRIVSAQVEYTRKVWYEDRCTCKHWLSLNVYGGRQHRR